MLIQNPVIPGFYPDPSICRVGEDYYIVVSSFSYFPGIPIFHSKDLAHWSQIGHVLTEKNWMDFSGLALSDGVWAPTIRHINGRYFVVYSVSHGPAGMKTYVVTADDVRGEWSTPKQLDVEGFDPSLFQDDDGRVWLTACKDRNPRVEGSPGCLWLREFDPVSCEVISDEIDLWSGALRNAWVEAPRIFKHDGTYWLVAAEGGTERGHAVTLATAQQIEGPYTGYGRNPALTHRHLDPAWPIQNVGHLDIVDDTEGNSWGVVLGVRPIQGHHTLGRETFLVPMKWTDYGPVFAPETGRVEMAFEATVPVHPVTLTQPATATPEDTREVPPEAAMLTQHWITPWRRTAYTQNDNAIVINAEPTKRTGPIQSAIMRRQTNQAFSFTCTLPAPTNGVAVSVFLMQNPQRCVEVRSTQIGTTLRVFDGEQITEHQICAPIVKSRPSPNKTPIKVRFNCDRVDFEYVVETDSGAGWITETKLPRAFLSTESAGGFVGVVMGINVAVQSKQAVTFEEVHYESLDR